MGPEFCSYEPRIIFIIKIISLFFITYIFEQLSLKLKILLTLDNILSISFNPRIIFEFFMGSILVSICLEAFCVKPRRREIIFMEMDGIYLSTREKIVCLKVSQASSGSIQSRIASQFMLLNSLFKASQFAFLKFKIFLFGALLLFTFDLTSKVNR